MSDYPIACEKGALFDVPFGAIEVTGPEAAMFLHNLTTNDIKGLKPGTGCEIFLTTHKARVIGHGVITCLEKERFRIQTERPQEVLQHLQRYLISEQAELALIPFASFVLLGPDSHRIVQEITGETDWQPWQQRGLFQRQAFWNLHGFVIQGEPAEVAVRIDDLMRRGVHRGTAETLEVLRIEAGLPRFGVDMDDQRFVVELDRTHQAICYTKGCYLGQEPIVMARDRGQVNRRFLGLLVADKEPVSAGTKVLEGSVEAGVVTSSVFSPGFGQVLCLAYLKRGSWQPGAMVALADGRRATISALPFPRAGTS